MKAGKDQQGLGMGGGGLWGGEIPGPSPEAGGLGPQGLDLGHQQLFPSKARPPTITASNLWFEIALSHNAQEARRVTSDNTGSSINYL